MPLVNRLSIKETLKIVNYSKVFKNFNELFNGYF